MYTLRSKRTSGNLHVGGVGRVAPGQIIDVDDETGEQLAGDTENWCVLSTSIIEPRTDLNFARASEAGPSSQGVSSSVEMLSPDAVGSPQSSTADTSGDSPRVDDDDAADESADESETPPATEQPQTQAITSQQIASSTQQRRKR